MGFADGRVWRYISKIFIGEILRGNKSVRSDCGPWRRHSCLRYSQNGNVGVTPMILSDGQFIIIWLSRPYPAQIITLFAFIYVFFRESECYLLWYTEIWLHNITRSFINFFRADVCKFVLPIYKFGATAKRVLRRDYILRFLSNYLNL